MQLQNAKSFPKPIKYFNNFKEKVKIFTNCDLTEDEIDLFNAALKAVSEYVHDNNIDLTDYFVLNVFFTYDGTISFTENDTKTCGSQFHVALYRMEKLRALHSYYMMIFTFIEELAHYFLREYNETVIKYKVEEIMRYIYPDFKLEGLARFKLNGL